MTRTHTDPLLTVSRLILAIFAGLLIFAMIMVAIGFVAALTIQRGEIMEEVADTGLAPATYWGILAAIVGAEAALFLGLRFVRELRKVVASVDDGDPFVVENAQRLSRMAWLAIAIQLISFPIELAGAYVDKLSGGDLGEVSPSGGGLMLVLTLFILARVFRKGTEMREELEGVV